MFFDQTYSLIKDLFFYYRTTTCILNKENETIEKYVAIIKKLECIINKKRDQKWKCHFEKIDILLRWFFRFELENEFGDSFIYANVILDMLFEEKNSRDCAGKLMAEALSKNLEYYQLIEESVELARKLRNAILHDGLESHKLFEKFENLIKSKKDLPNIKDFFLKEFTGSRLADGVVYLRLCLSKIIQAYILKTIERLCF